MGPITAPLPAVGSIGRWRRVCGGYDEACSATLPRQVTTPVGASPGSDPTRDRRRRIGDVR